MPSDHDLRVTPSLLDRLLDDDPDLPRDILPSRGESVRDLKRAVQRDLEVLLNSRNPHPDLSQAYVHAGQSILTFGLPDFSSMGANDTDRERVRQLIESAIRTFEPRLAGTTVMLLDDPEVKGALRLRVEARLVMDPAPEPVSFDIVRPEPTVRYEVNEAS